jgi:hypothetical protein
MAQRGSRSRGLVGKSLAAVLALAAIGSPQAGAGDADDDRGRPWATKRDLEAEFEDLVRQGKDVPAVKTAVSFALEHGLWHRVPKLLLDSGTSDPTILAMVGIAIVDGKPMVEEMVRRGVTARAYASLPTLTKERKKELLKDKDRELKLANQSTNFDLWSDLDAETIDHHSKILNDYWRKMRNRFRAELPTNVDVFIFGTRSSYLLVYLQLYKKFGEHVLGFYMPKRLALVYFNDPYDQEEVIETALHECTHLLIDMSFREAPMPRWFHEGIASYMEADGERVVGIQPMARVLDLYRALDKDRVDYVKLVKRRHDDFEYEQYPESWSFVHFLNEEGRREKFQKALAALRLVVTAETTAEQALESTREVFEETYGETIESLGAGAIAYFQNRFAVGEPEQLVELANAAAQRSTWDPKRFDRRRMIDIAAAASLAAKGRAEGSLEARRQLVDLEIAVQRAILAKAGDDEWRIVARMLRDGLRALPLQPDESTVAVLIRRALQAMSAAAGLAGSEGKPRDLRGALETHVGVAPTSRKERIMALTPLVEDLLEIGFARLAAVLEKDPHHRRATREWMFLALEAAPQKAAEAFPLLVTLTERDPDDLALAMLGLSYLGFGNEKYGKALLEEAKERSGQPTELAAFLEYAK